MHSFRKAAAIAAIAGLMLPVAAFAETSVTSSTTITASQQGMIDQLKALQTQIMGLQQQQQTIFSQLSVTLNQGSKGENVKLLQQLLSQDPSVYPEGTISGFFGHRTSEAVKRFQRKHGLDQAGNVGPKTLRKLNEIFGHNGTSTGSGEGDQDDHHGNMEKATAGMGMGMGRDGDHHDGDEHKPCFAPGRMMAPGFMKNFLGEDHGKDFKGNEGENKPCMMGTTTPPVVPPVVTDTTAPVISQVMTGDVSSTTANISWGTNEAANGKVYFGTTNPLVTGSAMAVATTTLSTSHWLRITGLSASTTYFYIVSSQDAALNTAASAQGTFTTAH